MYSAHFRMLVHEFLSKDPDIVPEEAYLTILDSNYTICMDNNDIHIYRRVHLVRNGEKWKMHKIDWCEGGLKLADIATNNVGKNNLNTIMKYIMIRLDNWYRTLVQEGWQYTG